MPQTRFLTSLVAVALIQPTLLRAQVPDSTRLEDLVVTATRTPTPRGAVGSSADRLDPVELDQRQVRSVRDALQLVSGGTLLTTGAPGGVASLFLRGVASTQSLFLLDGVRINDADASYSNWLGGAMLSSADRVEVVRGPQSTLYGGAAIGGVVSLITARGEGRPRGEVELDGGTFDTWQGRIRAQGSTGRLGATLALSANGTDNQRQPNDWHQRTQQVRLDYRLGPKIEAGATFHGLQQDYVSPGDIRSSNSTPDEATSFETKLATVWLETVPWSPWHSRLVAAVAEQRSDDSSRYNGGPKLGFTLENQREVLDWQNAVALGDRLELIAGVNREWSRATSDTDSLTQRLLGLYAEAQWRPLARLALTGGLRRDEYNSFGHAITYRLTAAWAVGGGTKLRASAGTGFMPPGLAARFGSVFQSPNPEIRPERSRGWDAGVDQTLWNGAVRVSASWFHNALRDLLGFVSAPYPALGQSVNIDRARAQGFELSSRYQRGRVDARLTYTLLSARSLSEPDSSLTRLIRRPRHTLSTDIRFSITSRGAVGTGLVSLLNREDTDFNVFPAVRVNPGDFAIARLYGSWEVGAGLLVSVRIENLFDTRYEPVYGFPALGRNLTVSLAERF